MECLLNIKRTITRLEDIIVYSEKEFLAISRTLNEIDRQTAAISAESTILNSLTSDSLFESQHAHFDLFLQEYRLTSPLPKVFDDGFNRISLLLENQHHLFQKLINHMKTIKKTDLVVRVELTHQDEQTESYAHLTEQVTQIADEIMNRTAALQNKTDLLQKTLENAGQKARDLFDNIEDRTRQILEESHIRLHFMYDHHKQAKELAEELASGATELLQRIDIMVSNLQTHDIVRQQLQQVISFMGHFDETSEPLAKLDSSIAILTKAHHDFFVSVDQIRMQLVTINTHLTLLLEQCVQLSSRRPSTFHKNENNPHQHMEELVNAADLYIKLDRVLDPLVADLVNELRLNQIELHDISTLSQDIALLAQNVALSAEQSSINRPSFNVLAEQTQRDISSVRISLDHLINEQLKIEQETGQFISLYKNTDQNIEIFFEKTSTIDELLQPLEQIQFSTTERILHLIPQMEKLITGINALIDTFHMDPHHSSAIGEAISVLSVTRHEIQPGDSGYSDTTRQKWTDYHTLRSNIEKNVHQSMIKQPLSESNMDRRPTPDTVDDIELF